jgi:hypothetical protein
VVKLQSSGGVVTRSTQLRKVARMQRVREYFYGVRGDLSPHSQSVRLDELHFFRIGGGPRAPTSALPLGSLPRPLTRRHWILLNASFPFPACETRQREEQRLCAERCRWRMSHVLHDFRVNAFGRIC